MTRMTFPRRSLILGAGAIGTGIIADPLSKLSAPFISPASAKSQFEPTQTMRGGANNYRPNAPLVQNLGSGFKMYGQVLKAGTGEPLEGVRIQIWAATTIGGEREPKNHGSVLTNADGTYELEMMQIVPNFGQPHGHLAYDDADFETVFLRPVMPSASDKSLEANFILNPA